MIKVTYQQVINFRTTAFNYQNKHSGKFSPLLFAINKMVAKTESLVEDYNEKVQEINQEFCEKDTAGFFKMDNAGTPSQSFKIPAEKFAARDKKVKALGKSEVEIQEHVSPSVIENLPTDIDFNWWLYLAPFVLPELTDEIADKMYEKQDERDKQPMLK